MIDIVVGLEVVLFVLSWAIQTVVVVPTLRRFKRVHWFDWIASGPHQIKNLLEFREFCRREREPMIWFNIQVVAAVVFTANLFIIYALSC